MGQYHNGSFRIEAIETHTHTHNVKEIMAQILPELMKILNTIFKNSINSEKVKTQETCFN